MASLENQQTWAPYQNIKDCSQGFCSLYCPQWCYIVFPPPPPSGFPKQSSGVNFSPLVIAIICILASSFLLVSYYFVVSKYCGRRRLQRGTDEEFNDSRSPSRLEPWQGATMGLDESLIKSISVCKYNKGDGLVEGTDCSVCLSEFQDGENLRLLPKCSHAFHLPCIDVWLKSHSNCPLCRAGIVSTGSLPPQLPPPEHESLLDHGSSTENRHDSDTVAAAQDLERGEEQPSLAGGAVVLKSLLRARSDLDGSTERDTIIEIRNEDIRPIRRSFSMDYSCHDRLSVADVLMMSTEEDCRFPGDVGSSKRCGEEHGKISVRSRVLHCVMSPTAMKRSSSSGRFLLTRNGRGRNAALPI